MQKAIRIICLAAVGLSMPVFYVDARLNGHWDAEGVFAAIFLALLVVFEPPVSLLVRRYFAWKKAERERLEHEREEAEQRAAIQAMRRRAAEIEETQREAEKRLAKSEAARTFAARQRSQ